MAKPRIFLSSTFYDLRQVRTDLERFIKELGYECVRNETGSIPYGKDYSPAEYCYKEISKIDILVGVVGGKFGSEAESKTYSITQTEIKTAIEQNKHVYLFIEKNVHSEFQTFLINKDNKVTKYRYVDDKRIYSFIEEIYSLTKNNIIHPFETAQDIISFLKEQWAGLFKEFLSQMNKKEQYENISLKVEELTEVSTTLKTYMESVLQSVTHEKKQAAVIISQEKERLEKVLFKQTLMSYSYISHLVNEHNLEIDTIIDGLNSSKSVDEFSELLKSKSKKLDGGTYTYGCMMNPRSIRDLNKVRILLKLDEYVLPEKNSVIVDSKNVKSLKEDKIEIKKLPPTKAKKQAGR